MKSSPVLLIISVMVFVATTLGVSARTEAVTEADSLFRAGNAAYGQGDFREASEIYRKAVQRGPVDSRLYYNYANSLFRLNQLGPAILYWEKALHLVPEDEDIRFNLEFANSRIRDRQPSPPPDRLTLWLWWTHSLFSPRQGFWIGLIFFTGLFGLSVLPSYLPSFRKWPVYLSMGLLALGCLLVTPSFVYKIYQQEKLEYGIVLVPSLDLRSGPGATFPVLAKIHEGTKFEVLDIKGDWASVKLPNGKGGFVKRSQLGLI